MKSWIVGLISVLACSAALRAQTCGASTVESFSASSNIGGWTYGGPQQSIAASGGFTGAYLRSANMDTFAPQLFTSQASLFTGNLRAAGVSSYGVDLQTFALDIQTCDRPLSILLESDNGTPGDPSDDYYVYFVSPNQVPCVDGLWHSYNFDVPTSSNVLPPGWALSPGTAIAPDVAWNSIVTNCVRVRYFYGDPTFFFLFAIWTCGADNLRVASNGGATTYCLSKLNSKSCQPAIASSGVASASQAAPFLVTASQVINNKPGILFYGHSPKNSPFQGGTLCVQTPIQRTPLQSSGGNAPPNDCSGAFSIDFNAWTQGGNDPSLQAGATIYGQYWSRDPASASTTSLSNAIRFTICG